MVIAAQRPLLCALLLSLLTACGGSQSSDAEEKSATGVETSVPASAPASEEATLARAAALNTASLAAAEKRALAAEDRSGSTELDKLTPGQIAPKSAYASGDIARKALAVGITAYRFYNTRSGAHFYTVSEEERDHVRNNLSPPYNYEGEAFRVASAYAPGLSPVHRFYNTRNGVHFYTISETERAHVAANLPHYTYEGVAYHASEVAGGQLIPFHRFYVPSKGFHFYTASEQEKNHIIANLGAVYRYEGVGYYVLDTQWGAEKLPHTGISAAGCYWADSDALNLCNDDKTTELALWQDGLIAALEFSRLEYGPEPKPAGGYFGLNECLRDKVTGLLWEGKNSGSDQPRYGSQRFTNLGNFAATDVSGHVAAVNASRLCGYSDWRVPSRMELQSILHYGNPQPFNAIDAQFLNTDSGVYWTRELASDDLSQAWMVDFGQFGGTSSPEPRTYTRAVRLVRGTPLGGGANRFSYTSITYPGDAANNVVNDNWTGLQWRRCEEGRNWNGSTCTGNLLTDSHEAMLARTQTLQGWRMPNIKELASLSDLSRGLGSRIDPVAFPGAAGATFLWSTTPYVQTPSYAWYLLVTSGAVTLYSRSGAFGVRLVRANHTIVN
jgi:hypothetical protein